MYADITKPPAPLPQPEVSKLGVGLTALAPLSRRGKGPGLIIFTSAHTTDETIDISSKEPSPIVKWAEEGYTVIQVASSYLDSESASIAIKKSLDALNSHPQCEPNRSVGLVCKLCFLSSDVDSHWLTSPSQAMMPNHGIQPHRTWSNFPRL